MAVSRLHHHTIRALLCAGWLLLANALYAQDVPEFACSDPSAGAALNDLFRRHLRYNEDSVGRDYGDPIPGVSTVTVWKEWDAIQFSWFASDTETFPGKPLNALMDHLRRDIPVDRFGYVWSGGSGAEPGMGGPEVHFGQGWPFPAYPSSRGLTCGWEWNEEEAPEGWTVRGGSFQSIQQGLAEIAVRDTPVQIISPRFTAEAFHAPFICLEFGITTARGNEPVTDLTVSWQVQDDERWSGERSVSLRNFATTPPEPFGDGVRRRFYLPMLMHDRWRDKIITRLALEAPLHPGDTLTLNYIRLDYDTRQQVNNPIFINAALRTYLWTGDNAFLEQAVPRMRKAGMFMLYHLGLLRSGAVDAAWFQGHDAQTAPGHGIGGSYWDLLPLGHYDTYATTMAFEACLAMAQLERILQSRPELDSVPPTVSGQLDMGDIEYRETEASWLDAAVKVQRTSQQLFWNKEKQRFVGCIDARGNPIDYGFVFVNLAAVRSGLASTEQANAIYDWLDGKRFIEGDTSTGKDIYAWRFAPRATTLRNTSFYVWPWLINARKVPFGEQVQDGGTSFYLSFDDLMNRIRVRGADDAYNRLQAILDWHRDVQQAGGKGADFYREYYAKHDGSLQGGGAAGGLGLDREFMESLLVPTAFLYGFMGVDSREDGVLDVRPNLPSAWLWASVTNARFQGLPFELLVRRDGFTLNVHAPRYFDQRIRVELPRPDGEFTVKAFDNPISWTPAPGRRIRIELPFENVAVNVVGGRK